MLFHKIFIIYCKATYSIQFTNNNYTNCRGCFNPIQGICLLNSDDTCNPFTKLQCTNKGSPWQWSNTSLNIWPTGCLSIIEAVGFACGDLLPICPNINYYLPHANSSKICSESAKANEIKMIGFDGLGVNNSESANCFAIKTFNGGCVWDKWEYYSWNNKGDVSQTKICGSTSVPNKICDITKHSKSISFIP